MKLVFSRGREVQCGTLYSDSVSWKIDEEVFEDFKKGKPCKTKES